MTSTAATSSSVLRRAAAAVAAGALVSPVAATVLATPAHALPFGIVSVQSGEVVLTAGDGANEIVVLHLDGSDPTSPVGYADANAALVAGPGCTQATSNGWNGTVVTCTPHHRATIHLGDGNDNIGSVAVGVSLVVYGGQGNDNLHGGAGDDLLDGGAGNDSLIGWEGNDTYVGGANDDTLAASHGSDSYSGGSGRDHLTYQSEYSLPYPFMIPQPGVRVDQDGVADDGAAGEGDNVSADIEDLTGGDGNDRLVPYNDTNVLSPYPGGGTPNVIDGGYGDDVLVGYAGGDTLIGGDGTDRAIGGTGTDTCSAEVEETCEI